MWLYFIQNNTLKELRKKRLLHVSPEQMLYQRLERCVSECHAIDNGASSYNYDFLLSIKDEDITNLTYKDESVNVIICNHVMEHVLNDHKAAAEIFRILEKGGKAYLMVPICMDAPHTIEDSTITTPEGREEAFGQWDHVRIYSRADFIARLEAAGFKVTPSRPRMTEEEMLRYGCEDKDEEIFVCEKV